MQRRFALGFAALLGTLGCSSSQPSEPVAPAKPATAARPETAAKPASAADRLVDTMTEYVIAIATIPFTGDCEAWSNAALRAEPIMLDIQQQMRALATSPDRDAIKADVIARSQQQAAVALEARGMTLADYDAYEAKIKSTCRGNPAFEAAMPRIALKKKAPPEP